MTLTTGDDAAGASDLNLLSQEIPPPAVGNRIQRHTHNVLERTNRYSPSTQSPYIKERTATDEKLFFSRGLYSVQVGTGKLGVYNKEGAAVHTIDLRKMALQMMTRAQSQASLAGMIDESFADGGSSFFADLAALMPGMTEIGSGRIANENMRIRSTNAAAATDDGTAIGLNKATGQDDFYPVSSGDMIMGAGPGSRTSGVRRPMQGASYGNMNSFIEPFDGIMPIGMFMIALYGILGVAFVGGIMDWIINDNNSLDPSGEEMAPSDPSSPNDLAFGRNRPRGGVGIEEKFFELFGLPKLENNFFHCLIQGLERFYDFPAVGDMMKNPSNLANFAEVMDTAVNLALAPGYYATITKQVLRDMEQITLAAEAMTINASVLNATSGFFKVVESVFSSSTYNFVKTMMIVGDIDIRSIQNPGSAMGELVLPVTKRNLMIPPTPYARMRVSRFLIGNLADDGNTVAGLEATNPLALTMFPSLLNMPTFGKFSGNMALHQKDMKGFVGKEKDAEKIAGKIIESQQKLFTYLANVHPDKSHVEAVENALDMEYMPFYVHDLRTDEIISMPAFITAFSEDFAAEYNESQGYGRTDAVMTYSKTKRTISLSFKLVSFNERDHEYMWFIINKLVTMCYPQRSQGLKRVFNDGAQSFIQPFSQTPTASPMVRLRLGEVLHSNYSKKNLGRLFGLLGGPGGSNLSQPVDKTKSAVAEARKRRQKTKLEQLRTQLTHQKEKGILKAFATQLLNGDQALKGQKMDLGKGIPIVCKIKGQKIKSYNNLLGPITSLKIEKIRKLKNGHVLIEFAAVTKDEVSKDHTKWASAFGSRLFRKFRFKDGKPRAKDADTPVNIEIRVKPNRKLEAYRPTNLKDEALKQAKDELRDEEKAVDVKAEDITTVADFMNSKKNPIVASFESTRGRGLAGFITQLGLGYEGALWETEIGSRAPQTVDVNLSFSPVHDLPLGLDSTGQIIAPSHPVGAMGTDPYIDETNTPQHGGTKRDAFTKDAGLLKLKQQDQAGYEVMLGEADLDIDPEG